MVKKEFEFEWTTIEDGLALRCGEFYIVCEDEPKARKLAEEKMKTILQNTNYILTITDETDVE